MKQVVSLIYELKNKGLRIELDEHALNLKVKGDTQQLSDADKQALTALKPDIIRFLSSNQSRKTTYAAIPRLPEAADYAVSSAQQRLWVLSQFTASNAAYSMPAALLAEGVLNRNKLEAAFAEMVTRYEILRTLFYVNESGEVRQQVKPAGYFEFTIALHDLQHEPDIDKALQNRLRAAEATPFDLATGPLLAVALFQLHSNRQVLFINIHHIICDGISMEMLLEEVMQRYQALCNGSTTACAPLAIQYRDYAHWQRQQLATADLKAHREYWLRQLAGKLPVLSLPADKVRPAVMTFNGSSVEGRLSKNTTAQLKALMQAQGGTLFMGLLAGMNALFYRYTGEEDIIIGTPVSGREHADLETQPGLFLNMLALRTQFSGTQSFSALLQQVKQVTLNAYQYQAYPFDQLVTELDLGRDASRSALFDVMLVMHNSRSQHSVAEVAGIPVHPYRINQAYSKFDFTFNCREQQEEVVFAIEYNTDIYSRAQAERMARHYEQLMQYLVQHEAQPVAAAIYLDTAEQQQLLVQFNNTTLAGTTEQTVVERFVQQVQRTPDAIAVVAGDTSFTYRELNTRVDELAAQLVKAGAGKGALAGIYAERSADMLAGLLAILKSGAAYVPLDPAYPQERIAGIIENAGIQLILTQARWAGRLSAFTAVQVLMDEVQEAAAHYAPADINADDLAYVIYTSGSTGKPKGVMVTHGNMSNFLCGMNQELDGRRDGDTLLAVTTISFDIAVLELFWTLVNGFKVVIAPSVHKPASAAAVQPPARKMDFSLFYFASETDYNNKYKLLIEGAKFGDTHGFAAIWTPERHFHEFGGVYPNPAITGAAIATITSNIHIRSGSCVLPLHNPIRVAEEWSVVDNLSQGRVGLSFASGWVMNDFLAFAPDHFEQRHATMYKGIAQVQALWKGDAITLKNPAGEDARVQIFPKPVQQQLPVWVTAADNPETFRTAGRIGANLLTHLLGQTVEELSDKIILYRQARKEAGYEGEGYVTLMIHTFVQEDALAVKEKVRKPFTGYLRHATGLVRTLARSMGQDIHAEAFSEADMEALLANAFDRYYNTAALFGSPASCLGMVNKLSQAGVDELGCLVDFGLDVNSTLDGFTQLNRLKELYAAKLLEKETVGASALELMRQHNVTHLQCTPSALKMMLAEEEAGSAFRSLTHLLVGGEPFPPSLLQQLQGVTTASVHNMYGPTETTVWSTTGSLQAGDTITAGRPIANTQVYVLDQQQQLVPVGVTGEIIIAGKGVTAGYLHAPALTEERFISNPYAAGERMYRTGDLGAWTADGRLLVLGRKDDQLKVRGYRIEPGEVEAVLRKQPGITDAVVKGSRNKSGDLELAAYIVSREATEITTLRQELARTLPDYMIPTRFMRLEALPLTPNGKVDKLALPDVEGESLVTGVAYVAARNELEKQLVELWSEVLERDPETIGVLDNFFELGGHSLNAVRLISLIKGRTGVKIDLQVLFYTPVIEELAQEIATIQWANRAAGEMQHSTERKTAKVRI